MVASPTLEANLKDVPEELRDTEQWVWWRWEENDSGERTKVPISPRTGDRASATKPGTWASFEEALEAYVEALEEYREKPDADKPPEPGGVGFVFSPDDPYCGVDLDHCLDPETGAFVDESAAAWVYEFNSYTEVSPSRDGVHVLMRGITPISGKKGDREMYSEGRFFTVTGDHLEGTPETLRSNQKALKAFYKETWEQPQAAERNGHTHQVPAATREMSDEALIEKILGSKQGAKFAKLYYAGDTSMHGGDDSSADMALCGMLAFWSGGDRERMDRLFRSSNLMRPKWDDVHHGDGGTYGEGTIDEALEGRTEFYEPKARVEHGFQAADPGGGLGAPTPLAEHILEGVEPPGELVPGILLAGHVTALFGPPGCGKSFIALWLALKCIERGRKVLLLDNENGIRIVAERLEALGVPTDGLDDLLHFYPFPSLSLGRGDVESYVSALDLLSRPWLSIKAKDSLSSVIASLPLFTKPKSTIT